MKKQEYRVKAIGLAGRFRIHDSKASALRHMANPPHFLSGREGKMEHEGKLQSRDVGISGDDDTWSDVEVGDAELSSFRS